MELEEQVAAGRQVIHTDAYPMSIGELINIYRDGEIDIHPEFQREYRWKPHQKSRLIESILLGIPLPSLFVAQRDDGVWDVVDGLQRISTILSFVGELKDEKDQPLSPLVLERTPYLPSLKGVSWSGVDATTPLPDELKRAFKREKVDIKIIKKESDENAKFELFQRLNTGGADLSEQEVRNCLLIMLNRDAYLWLKELSENNDLIGSVGISDRLSEQKYLMELVLRFFIATKFEPGMDISDSDMGPYITSQMKALLVGSQFDFTAEKEKFETTFSLIRNSLGDNSFKRFVPSKDKYEGQFSVSLFEFFTSGVAHSITQGKAHGDISNDIVRISKSLSDHDDFQIATKHGVRGIHRFPKLVEIARKMFS